MKRYLMHCFVLFTIFSCDLNGMAALDDQVVAQEQAAAHALKVVTNTVLHEAQQALNDAKDVKSAAEIDAALEVANSNIAANISLAEVSAGNKAEIEGLWTDTFYDPVRVVEDVAEKVTVLQTCFTALQKAIGIYHMICFVTTIQKYMPVTIYDGDGVAEDGEGDAEGEGDEDGDAAMGGVN